MVDQASAYLDANRDRFLRELGEFLAFPSISSQSEHRDDVIACAQWLCDHLNAIGLDARLVETHGHPIVEATGQGQSNRQLIIYGHYDVQPALDSEGWRTSPFEPHIENGLIVARGASDDKGPLFAHVKAIESLIRTEGELPCGVRFLFEGEEESGGDSLKTYIGKEKAALAPDAVVISDTCMYDANTAALTYGLRGIVGMEITVRVAERDLHSGAYGGAVGNPALALGHILDSCTGADGRIRINGFYDRVRPLADWEKNTIEALGFDEKTVLDETGTPAAFGEMDRSILERVWARPTLDVNGLYGGYQGKGMKTIIPATATAKITMRLVPDQDPEEIFELAAAHLRAQCPPFATVEIRGPFGAASPVLFDATSPAVDLAREALRFGFGAEPVLVRCGGSIPVAGTFWQELQKPVLLMGLSLDSDGAHSANEHFRIDSFINGAKTSAYFIKAFAKQT